MHNNIEFYEDYEQAQMKIKNIYHIRLQNASKNILLLFYLNLELLLLNLRKKGRWMYKTKKIEEFAERIKKYPIQNKDIHMITNLIIVKLLIYSKHNLSKI